MKTMNASEDSCSIVLLASPGRIDLFEDKNGTFTLEDPSH